jgi:hypothetical protein
MMIKKAGFWISIVFIVLAIISLLLYFHKKDTDVYAEKIITQTSEGFKKDLSMFLDNVHSITKVVKEDVAKVDVDAVNREQLLNYFTQLISKDDMLKGIILLGHKRNFVLIHNNNSWITTHSPLKDTLINWKRLDDKLQPVSEWTDLYNYFMELSDLNSIKISYLKDGKNVWRTAKSKIPEYRDLLFNIFKTTNANGVTNITILIYKAGELGNKFVNVLSFKEPLVTLITKNGQVITPIKTKDTTLIAKYDALTSDVSKIIKTWQTKQNEASHLYPFEKFNSQYWTRIDTINEQKVGIKAYALTIAEDDLLETALTKEEAYLYVALVFLLFALYIFLITYRKYKKVSTGAPLPDHLSDDEILKTIKAGETEHVEFKSSLRWDYREEKVNKALEDVILKSIAAFSNAKGGKLFIGVNDDMEVLGLQPDFDTLKKQNVDYFELHLRKLINNQYGIRFSNKHLYIQFPVIDGKTICIIHIHPSDGPLYVKVKNNQGKMVEKFYVRSGNSSQEITSLQEINEYINDRFK